MPRDMHGSWHVEDRIIGYDVMLRVLRYMCNDLLALKDALKELEIICKRRQWEKACLLNTVIESQANLCLSVS